MNTQTETKTSVRSLLGAQRSGRSALGLYTMGVAALFLAGFFLLLIFGAQSYRRAVTGQYDNMDTRALLAYLSTSVHANDSAGAVTVEEDLDVGPVLVITDRSSGYALRFYRHEGSLLEDFAAAGSPLRPEEAQKIGRTERFEIERRSDRLLAVTTDAGSVLLCLRSGEGGSA